MVWDAEQRGVLKPGKELIEPTSGNTGIALAFVAAARGYPITLAMPETMSIERRKVLHALGARLALTEGAAGMAGSIAKAEEMVASDPGSLRPAPAVQKSGEPGDPRPDHRPGDLGRHRRRDGRARFRRRNRRDHQRSLAIFQKDAGKQILSVAVEPTNSPVITQRLAGQPLRPGPHKIQGIGAGFIPDTLDLAMVDRVELVTNEESIEMARRLAREEGILGGISSGAAVAVAVRLAKSGEFAGKTLVVILPDAAERYLSTSLFEDLGQ